MRREFTRFVEATAVTSDWHDEGPDRLVEPLGTPLPLAAV
jgi:hypothetical protein